MNDRLRRRPSLDWRHVVVAILLALACAVAALGFSAASRARTTEYVGLGLDRATAEAGGSIVLALRVQNETSTTRPGTLRLEPVNPAAAPGFQPVIVEVDAPARGTSGVELRAPESCGVRLSVSLQLETTDRSLIVFVPCIQAAGVVP